MPYTHTNRRGQIYLPQSKSRKGGAVGYSFGMKLSGVPVDELPPGYEVWEDPYDAQVHCRKIKPTLILPADKELLIAAIRVHAGTPHVIVDVEKDNLTVYTAEIDEDLDRAYVKSGFGAHLDVGKLQERMFASARYAKTMKFTLEKGEGRLFFVSRWNFRGSIDDWRILEGGKPLAKLLDKYVRHLGRDSFFELYQSCCRPDAD